MTPRTSADLLLDELVEIVAARVADKLRGQLGTGATLCDQDTAPVARVTYLRAARRGKFEAWKVERRVVARTADVLAWVESCPRVPRLAPATDQADDDELAGVNEFADDLGYTRLTRADPLARRGKPKP